MVLYEKLGYETIEEFEKDLMDKLLITNHNFDYFVNWDKVYSNVQENLTEISILNSLNKVPHEEVENQFKTIITLYPEVVPILPSILAIRTQINNNNIIEIFDGDFHEYDFNEATFNPNDIIYFCKKTGLLTLFNRINDLYAYLLGTEVGLDTNARKNRSGTAFELTVEKFLINELKNYPEYEVYAQQYVNNIHRSKRSDYIIEKNGIQIIGIDSVRTANTRSSIERYIKHSDWDSDISFEIISIDTNNRKIYSTKVGNGQNRYWNY